MFLDKLYHMALPLSVMVFTSLGGLTRYVRATMIEALRMDYIRTARAKGLTEKVVIYSHAFRNALIPFITIMTGWFISIFSGSVVIGAPSSGMEWARSSSTRSTSRTSPSPWPW